jgi:hypothetical protein
MFNFYFGFVLFGCETWSLILREYDRLGVLGNGMSGKMLGPRKDKETQRSSVLCDGETLRLLILTKYWFLYGSTHLVGLGLFIFEFLRSHSYTPHSVELSWKSDRSVAETCTWQQTALTRDRHIHFVGGIPTLKHALDRAASGVGRKYC